MTKNHSAQRCYCVRFGLKFFKKRVKESSTTSLCHSATWSDQVDNTFTVVLFEFHVKSFYLVREIKLAEKFCVLIPHLEDVSH